MSDPNGLFAAELFAHLCEHCIGSLGWSGEVVGTGRSGGCIDLFFKELTDPEVHCECRGQGVNRLLSKVAFHQIVKEMRTYLVLGCCADMHDLLSLATMRQFQTLIPG